MEMKGRDVGLNLKVNVKEFYFYFRQIKYTLGKEPNALDCVIALRQGV